MEQLEVYGYKRLNDLISTMYELSFSSLEIGDAIIYLIHDITFWELKKDNLYESIGFVCLEHGGTHNANVFLPHLPCVSENKSQGCLRVKHCIWLCGSEMMNILVL